MKLCFVILNYCTYKETKKCIESIKDKLDLKENEYKIVVVDNNSPDCSYKYLIDDYKGDDSITILLNNENGGFSKGNNIGYIYAKKELNAEFIAMINSDTYLIQDDFFSQIEKEYKKSKFAVLGPKIILEDNKINVFKDKLESSFQIKKYLLKLSVFWFLSFFNLYKIIDKYNNFKKNKIHKDINVEMIKYNVPLHGCCWIFSKDYIVKFDGLDEKTFLYNEEDFLFLKLIRYNLKSVYCPNVLIFHDCNRATKNSSKTERKKRMFIYKNLIKSNKIFLEEIKMYEKNDKNI